MEDLLSRHRKEQKDLQARITQKKKSATKKTRRGINDECDRLQRELTERHQAEIAELNGETAPPADALEDLDLNGEAATNGDTKESESTQEGSGTGEPSTPDSASASTSASPSPTPSTDSSTPSTTSRGKKPNRQKARLARRAAEQAAAAAQAEEEASTQTNHRGNEKEIMDASFKKLKLKEIEINPDGHCLFSAVATQLDEMGLGLRPDPSRIILQSTTQTRVDTVASPKHDGYRAVRAVTADFISEHKDDFEPFMEEPIDAYTRKIKLTAEWGGQLELQAIARAYGVDINVVQGDGRIEKIESGDANGDVDEEEQKKRVIWLAYYRHTYGLGEHYNALTTRV
ncbi:deubiquitinase OTU2 [Aspergillus mulundensis]|uniref:Putative OTU-like cysteine protease n=1 Tax=Aspergillus mulundensis TaxID=1810919 RepID=A0A3D8QF22_9EURO|nr:putative OTU-like cysteine protease [Aspergillus mulundensis]RDW60456.1 putative OTU-like cysteine protease [Aspergillus mulundensis]